MARPSRQVDQALLASGAALYPQLGCAGLSVRAVAAHAGVAPGMFHYHFESKEHFLREVLQRFYDDIFAQLQGLADVQGPPVQRLREVLCTIGRFLRQHTAEVRRLLADAEAGEAVVQAFMQRNMPRHIKLLLKLLHEAEAAGQVAPQPALLRLTFLLGAVVTPVLVASFLQQSRALPVIVRPLVGPQVLSDEAIARRADMALRALAGDMQ